MADLLHRGLSALIALYFLIVTYQTAGGARLLLTGGYLLFVLACIWSPKAMGDFVGGAAPRITSPSHPRIVRWMGWVLLLFPLVIVPFYRGCLPGAD